MSSWITLNIACSDPDALAKHLKPEIDSIYGKESKLSGFSTHFPDGKKVYEYARGIDLMISTFTSRAGDPGTALDKYVSACSQAAAEADVDIDLIVGVTANDTSDMGSMRVYDPAVKWGAAKRYSGEFGGVLDGPPTLYETEVDASRHSIERLTPSVNEQIEAGYGVWPAIGRNYK